MTGMKNAPWVCDDAYDVFVKWYDSVKIDPLINEDTTRMRIIDAILFDVLKWDRNFVQTEEYVKSKGFADYILSNRAGRVLVLEAKPAHATFVLPTDSAYPSRVVPFRYISDKCNDAHKAMQQAVTYSNSMGARYTAISNGTQWLLMLTAVEGCTLNERNVLVFESLEAIRSRFGQFWDCMSPIMVQANKPHELLLVHKQLPAPPKLSASIPHYPIRREDQNVRNQHAASIQYIWDEINNNENTKTFFDECYVPPLGHNKNQGIVTQLLSDRAADDTASFEKLHVSKIRTVVNEEKRTERPVMLLGQIGRGKSTFIKYMKNVAALETLKKYVQIDIDFLDRPREKNEVGEFVYNAIVEQLRENYDIDAEEDKVVRAALAGPLNRFKKSTRAKAYADPSEANLLRDAELEFIDEQMSDRHNFLKLVTQLIRGTQGKSIVIFFDNLDKRPELQEEAFLVASSIARDWAVLVFVCLRPGTFQKSRDSGVLDSIAPRLIEVTAPPTTLFLTKRFDYAASIASGFKSPPRGSEALGKAIAQDGVDVSSLFSSFSESVRKEKSLSRLFECVANGDLREVIFRVGSIITSWHLDTKSMISAVRESGSYLVPFHQVLRSLLYGASQYFDPTKSPIVNLFDIEHADPAEHFLKPACLFELMPHGKGFGVQSFVRKEDLMSKVAVSGFTPHLIQRALQFVFERRLIEDDNFSASWPEGPVSFRLTPLGEYHISDLIKRFAYLDAIVVDTPVTSSDSQAEIRVVDSIRERAERGRSFLRYLHRCADSVKATSFYYYWHTVHDALANEITDIELRTQ